MSKQRYCWCIDNGHGKLQKGKRSPIFDDGKTQFLEYEFNRDIAERIMKALSEEGVEYFDVVPDYEQVGSFLKGRVERANNHKTDLPKIFLSIHANAGPQNQGDWSTANGIEVWHAQNSKKGKKLAIYFQNYLVDFTCWRDRGTKTRKSSFYVLRNTKMPAILTENGFFNNKEQVLELMKDDIRQTIADAHIQAIIQIEQYGII